MKKLIEKVRISTEFTLLSGLHIGGSKESVEIGGIDSPVIKIGTRNGEPYIPGSSIKGKIRCLLEQSKGIVEVGGGLRRKYSEKEEDCQKIIDLFGFGNDGIPSRLICRDAYLTKESLVLLENSKAFLDMPFTENKYENTIDRLTGKTKNGGLRQIERVPAGVVFHVEFVINVWDTVDDKEQSISLLKQGLQKLELDYIGGSGSRGYGHIAINWDMFNKYEPVPFT